MKRYGNLYNQIISWDNLLLAAKNAQRGKRYEFPVLRFNYDLESNLFQLQQELTDQTYVHGTYKTFEICDAKRRLISAAPYCDRVVHHALCQVVMPIFEKTFITHTFANRVGQGTHQALNCVRDYVYKYPFVFKADIQKYFPSIDHELLFDLILRKIKCPKTLWLVKHIIESWTSPFTHYHYFDGDDLFTPITYRCGIPIGNLTSQHFANIYLNPFDHFVHEQLRCSAYARYVDDFVLFSDSKNQLVDWRNKIESFLQQFRLRIHPIKSQIFSTARGVSFVGYRIWTNRVRVYSSNVRKARKRFKQVQSDYSNRKISLFDVKQRIMSWIGHVSHSDSWRLREKIICPLIFQRGKGVDAQGPPRG